jgi:hypothetical protein
VIRRRAAAVVLAVALLLPGAGRAEETRSPWGMPVDASHLGRFGAGVLAGLAAHEAGHVVANLALGNVPHIEGFLALHFIPFFAVRPNITCVGAAARQREGDLCWKRDGSVFGAGRRGKFAIVAAGFNVQYLGDELLLRGSPDLELADAPFRKGVLAFNVVTSAVYAVGTWTGLEDPRGDVANMADISGLSHDVLAVFVLLPALLDAVRYFDPDARWAPFAAATSKVTFIGLNFTF